MNDTSGYQILGHHYHSFKFPLNLEGKKNRLFQATWLKQYPWLVFSKELDGGLCKVFILFVRGEGGKSDGKLGKLVLEPLKTYKKATEILKHHNDNMTASKQFSLIMEGVRDDIVSLLNTAQNAAMEENKKKLIPIIKTIMFCGLQNIPLRGHRGDGQLLTEAGKKHIREGNFRALLKFRIEAGIRGLNHRYSHVGKMLHT